MARLLIAEDDKAIATLLDYNLRRAGHNIAIAEDGEAAHLLLKEQEFDCAILDWMLPLLSGLELLRIVRRLQPRCAVMMVTARGEEEDKLRGLDAGADDYVTKPFSVAELISRLKALLRRTKPVTDETILRFADIELDIEAHRVRRNGMLIHLGPTEYRLLRHFMAHPRRVYSREQLQDLLWGQDSDIESRTIDVHIGRLRKALGRGANGKDPLRTVRAAGYALDDTSE